MSIETALAISGNRVLISIFAGDVVSDVEKQVALVLVVSRIALKRARDFLFIELNVVCGGAPCFGGVFWER